MNYSFDFASVIAARGLLLQGVTATLYLAASGIFISLLLGIIFGAGRCSSNRIVKFIATGYVEFFRNIPVLVLMMWFYFALPIALGVGVSAYVAAACALGLNSGAFSAEIIRASITAVHRSQWEAGGAIGMSRWQQLHRVILPQALKLMIPSFTNRWIELTKLTSLAAAIAFPELLYSSRTIAAAYFNPIEAFTMAALLYMIILLPMTQGVMLLERRLAKKD